jgi:hypothetical protein
VKTTLDLPAELVRAVKIRAVHENRKLKDMVAELLRRGLSVPRPEHRGGASRVSLPLIVTKHPAHPGDEMTPERVAQVLLDDDANRAGED